MAPACNLASTKALTALHAAALPLHPFPLCTRPRSALARPGSRSGSFIDPLSDAEALAAAQAVAQQQQGQDGPGSATSAGSPPAETAEQAASDAAQQADSLGNEQMVWEMLYNPDYCLPTAEAEAAWHRAMGKTEDEEQVGCVCMAGLGCRCRTQCQQSSWLQGCETFKN